MRRVEESLQHVIPEDPNVPYDIKDIIEPIVDNHTSSRLCLILLAIL